MAKIISSAGYTGNKASFGSFQKIINQFPPHENFISGFGGSGAIEKRKTMASVVNIVCEISENVIKKYWRDEQTYSVLNVDFLKWYREYLAFYRHIGKTLVYADPPYLLSSRNSGRLYYENELSEEKHIELLELLKKSPDNVAISHYKASMYDSILKGWRFIEWPVMTHQGLKKEGLYMNYEQPAQLHQYDFLGDNRTQRQQIKRKKKRFIEKLERLPDLERYAILAALKEYNDSAG